MKLTELLRATADIVDKDDESPEAIKAFYEALVLLRDTLNEVIEAYPG